MMGKSKKKIDIGTVFPLACMVLIGLSLIISIMAAVGAEKRQEITVGDIEQFEQCFTGGDDLYYGENMARIERRRENGANSDELEAANFEEALFKATYKNDCIKKKLAQLKERKDGAD